MLLRKAQHPVLAKRPQNLREYRPVELPVEVDPLDRRAQRLTGRSDPDHRFSPTNSCCSPAASASAESESGPLSIERAAYSNCSGVAMPISTVETALLAMT